LQHNVAHLGIATGLCLSEAATEYMPKPLSRGVLTTAMLASVSTSLAEILGGAIALNMLFEVPLILGALLTMVFVGVMVFTNTYTKIERSIIAFVSIIGLSFIYELSLVNIDWPQAMVGWVKPVIPNGSILIVMSVLGAVVMPHNLFLHSEVIQSRQWNLEDEKIIHKQLKYEFFDTLLSMIVGWVINSAMILLAATAFYNNNLHVTELPQAANLLIPLLGKSASVVFAVALLLSGISSTTTSAMSGGSIFAGIYKEPFDIKDNHSRLGVCISLVVAFVIILFIRDAFRGLVISQMVLSIQLPITVFAQIYLTSSSKVMGKYVNRKRTTALLLIIAAVLTYLNVLLFMSFF